MTRRKPNRETAQAPKLGTFWCGGCDAVKVRQWAKCPRCGTRNGRRVAKR